MLGDVDGVLCYVFNQLHIHARERSSLLGVEEVAKFVYVIYQSALIFGSHRDNVIHSQIAEHAGFDLYLLGVHLPLHFVAGFELFASHHTGGFKHSYACIR